MVEHMISSSKNHGYWVCQDFWHGWRFNSAQQKHTHTHIYIDIFVEHYIQTIPQAKKIDQVGWSLVFL